MLGDILVGPVSGLLRPPPCLLDYSCKSGLNFFHMSFFSSLHYFDGGEIERWKNGKREPDFLSDFEGQKQA
jgi:hypothetical protein